LPPTQIASQVTPIRGGFRITLSADKFAKAVYLSSPDHAGFFVDNYFDLIPGEKVEVQFRTRSPIRLSDFRAKLKIRTLADAF
jgi:beta-mannosidase